MKTYIIILIISFSFFISQEIYSQAVGITDDQSYIVDNSAILDVNSTNKGILIPRIDFNDKPATPTNGLMVYVISNGPQGNDAFYYYNGSNWIKVITTEDENNYGSTFTRYGSSVAPTNSSLIYSGYVYGEYYNHAGRVDPIILQDGDPGAIIPVNEAIIYPVTLLGFTIPGITHGKYLTAAVCFINAPTSIVWGSHNIPSGWNLLYKGYAYSAHYGHTGSINGPICIDSDDFEVNANSGNTSNGVIYPIKIGTPIQGYVQNSAIKCMVLSKD